mgnify:CR=1 FL=1
MQCFAKSDRGAVRKENQDRAAGARIRRKGCVVGVVCDGMGGAAGGKLASELAASTFLAQFRREMMAGSAVEPAMRAACDAANQAVYGRACADPELRGMGTTIVAACVRHGRLTVLHVGDSRAYIMSGGTLRQISEDHSYVEEMRRLGRISEADARSHPQKNLITRAVGVDATVDGDLFEQTLADGDILLLCSDGLTGMVEDGKIAEVLAGAGTLEDKGRELLTLALEGGGRDNITVALFTCGAKQEA